MQIVLDMHSRVPIYEQIEQEIILQIHSGVLKPNEQLPSLRQLSAQLSLNINTIKRALSELEAKGVIYSIAGKGIFVSPQSGKTDPYLKDALQKVEEAIHTAKAFGASFEDVETILQTLYEGVEKQ